MSFCLVFHNLKRMRGTSLLRQVDAVTRSLAYASGCERPKHATSKLTLPNCCIKTTAALNCSAVVMFTNAERVCQPSAYSLSSAGGGGMNLGAVGSMRSVSGVNAGFLEAGSECSQF
jgi:hypothetical protein